MVKTLDSIISHASGKELKKVYRKVYYTQNHILNEDAGMPLIFFASRMDEHNRDTDEYPVISLCKEAARPTDCRHSPLISRKNTGGEA